MAKCYASKIINIALKEEGYLEKETNKNLDSKTANAGDENYTKYARDLDALGNFYNGKKNGYAWCDMFVDWCFIKAYGREDAQRLLCQPNKSLGAGCTYSYDYYKAKGLTGSKPKKGAQIFFTNAAGKIVHTALVYDFDKEYVYTVEGNTSSAEGVVANGGAVVKKKYKLTYARIKGYGYPAYDAEPKKKNYLSRGDEGEEVAAMQTKLIYLGYSCGKAGADGKFGDGTENALECFQKAEGLEPDGKYGSQSKARLEARYNAKKAAPKVTYLSCKGKYTGKSITQALKAINVDSSFAYRKKLAAKNNIKDYEGTAAQNIKLLNLLKQGKLIKA